MPLITQPILPQSFEYIRDRIWEIIDDELQNQLDMQYENFEPIIFLERAIRIDLTEMPCVNICWARGGGNSDNKKIGRDSDQSYNYTIDVYTKSKSSAGTSGDDLSSIQCQRIMGIIAAILRDGVYKTLGFEPGTIVISVTVEEMGIMPANDDDTNNCRAGRIMVSVRAVELTNGLVPTLIAGQTTKIILGSGNIGLQYDLTN